MQCECSCAATLSPADSFQPVTFATETPRFLPSPRQTFKPILSCPRPIKPPALSRNKLPISLYSHPSHGHLARFQVAPVYSNDLRESYTSLSSFYRLLLKSQPQPQRFAIEMSKSSIDSTSAFSITISIPPSHAQFPPRKTHRRFSRPIWFQPLPTHEQLAIPTPHDRHRVFPSATSSPLSTRSAVPFFGFSPLAIMHLFLAPLNL